MHGVCHSYFCCSKLNVSLDYEMFVFLEELLISIALHNDNYLFNWCKLQVKVLFKAKIETIYRETHELHDTFVCGSPIMMTHQ